MLCKILAFWCWLAYDDIFASLCLWTYILILSYLNFDVTFQNSEWTKCSKYTHHSWFVCRSYWNVGPVSIHVCSQEVHGWTKRTEEQGTKSKYNTEHHITSYGHEVFPSKGISVVQNCCLLLYGNLSKFWWEQIASHLVHTPSFSSSCRVRDSGWHSCKITGNSLK